MLHLLLVNKCYFSNIVRQLGFRLMQMSHLSLDSEVSEQLRSSYVNEEAKDKVQKSDFNDERYESLLRELATPPKYTILRVNTLFETTQYSIKNLPTPEILQHPLLPDTLVVPNHKKNEHLPHHEKEVIVDLACGMAVLRGANIFAQGIMAAHPGMQADDTVSVFSDIDGMCRKGLTQAFQGKKIFVGNGIAKISRQDLFCSSDSNLPSGLGVQMTEPLYDAPSLNDLLPSMVFSQNLPSVVCSHVLNPQPGEIVLDMCSAPGGKTTHIATLMKNKGRVIGLDKAKNKLEKIRMNVKQLGLDCVEIYGYDSTKAMDENAQLNGSPPYPAKAFDRILLDGPCSALGQRPSLKNKMSIKELNSYSVLQKKLFKTAVSLLKTGGTLVYSTCTLTLEENEKLVKWALDKYACLALDQQEPHVGGYGLYGAGLSDVKLKLLQRFDPSDTRQRQHHLEISELERHLIRCNHDTIGFFIAKFVKR
ncbi:tRNA (cytosine(72)-C(5))-methyltransferase NSUN6-like isoform X2 [Tubulanus polymorphus]|uniref:tRNA (cytosine(72)-C(5))-methyltransferase NSUN6-like isoform X2 n=1 Tax=Tubulanus polymorphus TaxID=672921 RepID=UPI003DA32631